MSNQAIVILALLAASASAQEGWWTNEPIRWVQTNLRQTDAELDAARLVEQLADMGANVLLLDRPIPTRSRGFRRRVSE